MGGPECNFSFADLFYAAHKRIPAREELEHFLEAPQPIRNELVKAWANTAKWYTLDKLGTDGQTYTAFAPFLLNHES